jgi:hypothetical protein
VIGVLVDDQQQVGRPLVDRRVMEAVPAGRDPLREVAEGMITTILYRSSSDVDRACPAEGHAPLPQ